MIDTKIERSSNTANIPKYYLLRSNLLQELDKKNLKPGDKFYSENEISERFNVSPFTTRRAVSLLTEEGYLRSEQGRGTFVVSIPKEPHSMRVMEDAIIGVLFCEMEESGTVAVQKVITGIEQEASDSGYLLLLARVKSNEEIPRIIKHRHVDGLITIGNVSQGVADMLKNIKDIQVVIIGSQELREFHNISSTPEIGGYQACQYLLELGHRRIGLISGSKVFSKNVTLDITKGLEKAFEEKGYDFSHDLIKIESDISDYELADEILKIKNRATAILAANWLSTLSVLQAISDRGLRVPEDVSVIGHGDNVVAMHTKPELTCIKLFSEYIGAEAVKLLVRCIREGITSPVRVRYPIEKLVIRGSCSPLTA